MLVNDSSLQAKHNTMTQAEQARDNVLSWVREHLKDSVYVADNATSPTNVERQMGRALPVAEVERRLLKLNSNFRFENHPHNKTKKVMYYVRPSGEKQMIMPYENGLIPEHSIMGAVIKETLEPTVAQSTFHIDRKSLTKHEVIPHEFDENGNLKKLGDVVWDDTVPILGMKREKIPWCETVRGYRTMLVILVHAGYITTTQAEQAFGSVNRPEWQKHMGKKDHKLPW
jgi:hypothetical protein